MKQKPSDHLCRALFGRETLLASGDFLSKVEGIVQVRWPQAIVVFNLEGGESWHTAEHQLCLYVGEMDYMSVAYQLPPGDKKAWDANVAAAALIKQMEA